MYKRRMIYLISMLELPNITPLTREPVKKREEKFKFHSNDIVCRSYTVYCSISFRSILFCVVRYRGMFLIQTQCSVLLADIRMVFVCIFFEFLFFHFCVLFIRLFLFSCILLMDRIATFVAWLFVYFLVITRTPISFWFSFFLGTVGSWYTSIAWLWYVYAWGKSNDRLYDTHAPSYSILTAASSFSFSFFSYSHLSTSCTFF